MAAGRKQMESLCERGPEQDRPHPSPLAQGVGTPHPAPRRVEALPIVESAAYGSPSPRGEGWGEGEDPFRNPARLRTADEVNCPEQRKTKFHARQSDKSLTIASLLPPHPSPLPEERENQAPRLGSLVSGGRGPLREGYPKHECLLEGHSSQASSLVAMEERSTGLVIF